MPTGKSKYCSMIILFLLSWNYSFGIDRNFTNEKCSVEYNFIKDNNIRRLNWFTLSDLILDEKIDKSFQFEMLDANFLFTGSTDFPQKQFLDGSLWQGKGLNGFFSAGLLVNYKWLYLTIKPEVWASQNLCYDIIDPAASQENQEWGYFFHGMDYPQRMGDTALYNIDWGQSEVRIKVSNFTAGFSHQNIKIGPSIVNPLLLSNNAPGFWHVDIGFDTVKTRIGMLEGHGFWGRLEESEFFNTNPLDDYTFISGISFSYAPSFVNGLTVGVHRTLTSNWSNLDAKTFFTLFNPNFFDHSYGGDAIDQKALITMDYRLIDSEFRIYGELFFEDYITNLNLLLLTPEHATAFTIGVQKVFQIPFSNMLFTFEYTDLQQSRDYEIIWGAGGTYYTHSAVYHGYTNEGQLLGAPIGPGSEAQTLLLDFMMNWGKIGFKLQRINWQQDYLYRDPSVSSDPEGKDQTRLNVSLNFGINTCIPIGSWVLSAEGMFSGILNPNYTQDTQDYNFYTAIGATYSF